MLLPSAIAGGQGGGARMAKSTGWQAETEAMAMATDNSGTLALLIDGDNASPKIVVGLMAEIANYGVASVKRIYGDWTGPASPASASSRATVTSLASPPASMSRASPSM